MAQSVKRLIPFFRPNAAASGSSAPRDAADQRGLADVLEVVGHHADEPDAEGHRRIERAVDDPVEIAVAERTHELDRARVHGVVIVDQQHARRDAHRGDVVRAVPVAGRPWVEGQPEPLVPPAGRPHLLARRCRRDVIVLDASEVPDEPRNRVCFGVDPEGQLLGAQTVDDVVNERANAVERVDEERRAVHANSLPEGSAGHADRARGLHVGTSGWHYADWRGAFYPKTLATREWLAYYAQRFPTVELNNTFYRLPNRSGFESWAAQTPEGFVFTVKASRYLTHIRRLRDPAEPVARLLDAASGLGEKLGPVLLQFPPSLRLDEPALAAALDAFGGRVRVACEFRHDSWHCDGVYELLRSRDAALALTDRRSRHGPLVRTAAWGFLRMHEGRATPAPCYGHAALTTWVERLADLWGRHADCFVYFNNDHAACAVRDAQTFAALARRRGLDVHEAAPARPPGAD